MKILAFSLYGDDPIYTVGAIKNSILHKTIFSEWEMRVYHNDTVPKNILDELSNNGVNLINVGVDVGYMGSLWRFLPASEGIERFISRDCDSRISERDECAVNEWITTDKDFHIIREHPIGHNWVINAGMWGCKGGVINNIRNVMNDFLSRFDSKNNKYSDQIFLKEVIYPMTKNKVIVHDEFFNFEGIGVEIKRDRKLDNFAFIGESIDENDEPRGDQRSPIIKLYNSK